jgi:hypothetical protein
MSQLSFSSFDASLMVRDAQGRYLLATADQILEAARQAIEHKMQRGARSLRRRRSRSTCAPSWPASSMRCSRCCSSIRSIG